MEPIGGILLSEENPGALKGDRNQKAMPLTGSVMRRKRFSDITNITSNGRSERSEGCEKAKSADDYIAMLLKENNALMRLVDERNKIIEITGMELQKHKISLQKANQQNWQLAQANSHMLAELNLGKDRLKALQHELGCTVASLRAKTLELQEEKKLNKQHKKVKEKIGTEESHLKPNAAIVEPSHPTKFIKASNTNRKRTLRSQSLGPTTVTCQETAKKKDEGRRKSLRRVGNTKSGLCEPTDNLFEIEDLKLPIRLHEDSCSGTTTPPTASDTVMRDEDHLRDQSVSPQHQNQGARRSSLGRPMRRAAVKVNSYKEVPLNIKMRRVE